MASVIEMMKRMWIFPFLLLGTGLALPAGSRAAMIESGGQGILQDPAKVGSMEVWDSAMGMAMPFPMAHMPMSMLMFHGYGFFEAVAEEGLARGRAGFSAPNMFMIDLGTSVGDSQYLNVDLMLTTDLWLVPKNGTPELFQIGEAQADGTPFLDAQHPHSSPIMGLTLSDTIALDASDKSCLKLFAAPRGESTDGPVAYMHRLTGMVNPDTPLGHHIGQDVGHISGAVLGGSLKLGPFHAEASFFDGTEPQPTQVDLPVRSPDSFGLRVIGDITGDIQVMASYADVRDPEPGVAKAERFSASLYTHSPLSENWTFHNTLIYGGITHIDQADLLSSILEEFAFTSERMAVFGRVEVLQRTPDQLGVTGSSDPDTGRWLGALSVGFSHRVAAWDGWELRAGAEMTNDITPSEYSGLYEGNPFSYKFFFQLGGSQMVGL